MLAPGSSGGVRANASAGGGTASPGELPFRRGGEASSGPFIAQGLGAPIGIAFDAAGNLFAADHGGKRVVKVTPSRTVSTLASLAERPYGIAQAPGGTVTVSTQGLAGTAFLNLNDVKIYSVASR